MPDHKTYRNKRLGQSRLSVLEVSKKQRELSESEDLSSTPTIVILETEEEKESKESLKENSASTIDELSHPSPQQTESKGASQPLSQSQISLFFSPPMRSKNSLIFTTQKANGSNFNFDDMGEDDFRIDSYAAQSLQSRPRFHGLKSRGAPFVQRDTNGKVIRSLNEHCELVRTAVAHILSLDLATPHPVNQVP